MKKIELLNAKYFITSGVGCDVFRGHEMCFNIELWLVITNPFPAFIYE